MKALAAALILFASAAAADDAMPPAIGRISYGDSLQPGAAICSGTLVAPDLVLTAGHCVRGAAATPGAIRYSAGLTDGISVAEGRGAEVILAAGGGLAADAALVRLARPMPATVTPLRLGPETGPRLTRFAYRRDRPDTAERADMCLVLAEEGPVLRLGCTAVTGHSGAAVLSQANGVWQVAGVMVARQTAGFGSIAVRVPDDLQDLIAED